MLIVGGGLAGGIIADRLTAAGRDCILLEAGRHFKTEDFPLAPIEQGQLFWNQGMEFTCDGTVFVLRGKCVGGSSVVNQALLDRLPDEALDRWRAKTELELFDAKAFGARYDDLLASGDFAHQVIPDEAHNTNARHFAAGMARNGWKTKNLHRAQADCHWADGQNCIDCLGGCARASKQSALVTSLPRAQARGLVVRSGVHVERVREGDGRVDVEARVDGRRERFSAREVVLAAGALGTPELLLRTGHASADPAIGQGFHIHPQFNSWGRFPEPVDPHLGAFQSIASDEPAFAAQGFKLECVAIPPAVAAVAMPSRRLADPTLRDYRHWGCIEASIRDTEAGSIRLNRLGRRSIDKPLAAIDRQKLTAARGAMHDVLRAAGADTVLDAWLGFSVHPMGGCAIGTDESRAPVDERFRLRAARSIRVADASLFPDAPGCNPSLTVMVLAHACADAMLGASVRGATI